MSFVNRATGKNGSKGLKSAQMAKSVIFYVEVWFYGK
jgi:hypothetical protein